MGLFSKNSEMGIFVVMKDEDTKETYVLKLSKTEYEENQLKFSKYSRFDNEKAAIKEAKSCMKRIPGWSFNKDRCRT